MKILLWFGFQITFRDRIMAKFYKISVIPPRLGSEEKGETCFQALFEKKVA